MSVSLIELESKVIVETSPVKRFGCSIQRFKEKATCK
jgi:hypothetical protein